LHDAVLHAARRNRRGAAPGPVILRDVAGIHPELPGPCRHRGSCDSASLRAGWRPV